MERLERKRRVLGERLFDLEYRRGTLLHEQWEIERQKEQWKKKLEREERENTLQELRYREMIDQ